MGIEPLPVALDHGLMAKWIEDVNKRVSELPEKERKSLILRLIGSLDLTTLSGDDTPDRVIKLIEKAVNPLQCEEPTERCAAVCVYPARVCDAVEYLKNIGGHQMKVASVAGGFPSGQYRLETRLLEVKYAIEDGAVEIDAVINRCAALTGQWQVVYEELVRMKEICGEKALLKTILATGELGTLENVYKASMIAMEAGSDFIKTSTGKESVNATLPVSWVMCHAIKLFDEKTGRKVGFKPAGNIKTTDEALAYFLLVQSILGEDWMNPRLFRIGASSLLGDLVRQYA